MHSFYFHQSEQAKHLDLSTFEKQLGEEAKLGLSFYLIDKDGNIITEEGHRSHEALPMASTMKIAIALVILKHVFQENSLALNDNITLDEQDFSPGPPANPLDQYFFGSSAKSVGLRRLLKPTKLVIQRYLQAFYRFKTVRFSDSEFCFVI